MNVLLLCPALADTYPSQRYRIEQWMPYLEGEGIRFTLVPFEDEALHEIIYQSGKSFAKAYHVLRALFRRVGVPLGVGKYDLAYILREACLLGPALIERLIAWRKVPIVYDFDDAIWVPYVSPANRYLSYLKCFGKTATVCRLSSHVLVGNDYLAEYARRYNSQVTVIPTTIDDVTYRVRPYPVSQDAPVTIAWTGSYSTVQYLDTLRGALLRLRQRYPYRLMVIGTPGYRLDGVEVTARPWRSSTEVSDLQECDIGLMPLPDDPWARGKCGLKLLQYMGVGLPVVASPVGVNREIVQDDVTGFLATTEDDWVDRLERLIRDARMRQSMGMRGRQMLEERYSARQWAPRVGAIFKQVASPAMLGSAQSRNRRLEA
jgi:glycosyltransferase involved in cell wall biosynthesis